MGLIDAALISMMSAIACLAFPKFLFMLLSLKSKINKPAAMNCSLNTAKIATTSFPYCTAYPITGSQFCRFSPQFCSRCSLYQ
jgi:hypothetical protein